MKEMLNNLIKLKKYYYFNFRFNYSLILTIKYIKGFDTVFHFTYLNNFKIEYLKKYLINIKD